MNKVEEAEARARKAQEDLETARKEEQRAKYEAEQLKKQEKLELAQKAKQVMRDALLAEVVKLKPTASLNDNGSIVIVEGEYKDTIGVSLVEESSYFYSNGKVRLMVGSYGETKQFPQKKDGTHSYAAAASHVVYLFESTKNRYNERKEKESTSEANRPAAEDLRKRFPFASIYPSQYEAGKVEIILKNDATLTPEEAEAFLTAYKTLIATLPPH